MKNNIKYFLVFVLMMFICTSASAQEAKIAYLNKEEKAPFAGYLLSPVALAEMQAKISVVEAEWTAKMDYELKKQKAELEYKIAVEKANNNFLKKENGILIKDTEYWKKQSKRTLWERIDMSIGVGIGSLASYYLITVMLKTSETR